MRNIQTLSLLVVTAAALLAGCQSEQDIIDHVRTEIEDAHWAQRQVARYAAPQKKLTELLQQRPEVRHAIVSLQPDYTTTPIGPRPIVTFKIFVRLYPSAEKEEETSAAEIPFLCNNDGPDEFANYLRQALADSGLTLEHLYTQQPCEKTYAIHVDDQLVIIGRVRLKNSSADKP